MPSQDSNTPPSHVTVAVVLQVRDSLLQALLWQRAREPFAGAWSLPGGRLRPGETLADSIRAHLATKVDVRGLAWLEQLETLSEPGRHPDEWQLATAYLGLVPSDVDPALPLRHALVSRRRAAGGDRLRPRADRARRPRATARQALLHEHRLRARARRRSRSPSCATSTPPRSATASRPRTSNACSSGVACSSRPATALPRPRRRPPRRRLPLPLAGDGGHGPVRGAASARVVADDAGPSSTGASCWRERMPSLS